jgi:hypothetical protein
VNQKIIAFTGPKGVGKTSLAQIISLNQPAFSTQILSFAAPIKKMLWAMGIDMNLINDPNKKDLKIDWLDCSPRKIMQTLGTDWGRNMIDSNIWIKLAKKQIEESKKPIILIDDCDNEADMVRDLGGYVVELYREGFDQYTNEHDSEKGDRGDKVRVNIESLSEAAEAIDLTLL